MKKVFLSEKNIANQTKKLITLLNLEPEQLTKDTVIKCKKIIVNSMESTFDKYGEKKPESIAPVEYLNKMNKKSLSDCLKIFDDKKEAKMNSVYPREQQLKDSTPKKKPQNNPFGIQPNNNQYMRPDEIMSKMKHPEQTKSPSKEYQSFSDAGGYASFSSVDTASGPFITATGEYGLPIEMQGQMQGGQMGNQMQSTNDGKKNFADELQKKMDALRYEGGYRGGGQGGMQQQGFQQQGFQQQQNMGNQVEFLQKMLPGVDMSTFMNQNGIGQNQGSQQQQSFQQQNPTTQFAQLSQMMNQMQQSGNINPQMMQQMMQQMQMLIAQMQGGEQGMQNNQTQRRQTTGNQQQMQGDQQQPQQSFDLEYSFDAKGDNIGNDFNAAYGGNSSYTGVDSFDGAYQHNSITGPVKNLSEQSGDLGDAYEKMKAEREQINNSLGNMQKPQNFDPMQSPSQLQGNNQKFNDNFFF